MNPYLKIIVRGFCIALVVLIAMPPQPPPAHAVGGVGDDVHDFITEVATTVSKGYDYIASGATSFLAQKEGVLDPIAWAVAKTAIASMTQSMVNWINSGFNGSPAFVPNLQVYLGTMNYSTANTFTNQLATNPAISSPFQSQVASLLNVNFLKSASGNGFFLQNPYTLGTVSTNPAGFVNGTTNFTSGGGWGAWFALTTQPQNNVYGAYNLAQNELSTRLATTQSNSLTQLGWGQGFLSWCGAAANSSLAAAPTLTTGGGTFSGATPTFTQNSDGTNSTGTNGVTNVALPSQTQVSSTPKPNCTNSNGTPGNIQTPGSVIQAQLNKTLGLQGDTLVTADEFNEVIGALIGQLVNQVVGPTGLTGVSSVSSGGTGYIDQATAQNNSTVGASASAALNSAISSDLANITQFQADWQTIGNEAGAANAALPSCVAPPDGAATAVASTTAAAAAGATEAANGIAALSAIRTELTSAGNNATALSNAANDYQTLTASTTIPSASDIANIDAQAQDSSAGATASTTLSSLTLYGQMKFIVNQCTAPLSGA